MTAHPNPHPGAPATNRRGEAGFTFVEVLISLLALAVTGIVVMQGALNSAAALGRAETCTVALETARGLGDRIAATPIDEVVSIWGLDGTEGSTFQFEALNGNIATCSVSIVTDETETDPDLVQAFGLPRDLDGDGAAATKDVSQTARALPVLIEVRWGVDDTERLSLPVVVVR